MTHKCEVPSCTKQIPQDKIMCLAHWKLVPKTLQFTVYATWNERLREETPETRRKHNNAKALAVQAVKEVALTGSARIGRSDYEPEEE